jgi:hypothetical protein
MRELQNQSKVEARAAVTTPKCEAGRFFARSPASLNLLNLEVIEK